MRITRRLKNIPSTLVYTVRGENTNATRGLDGNWTPHRRLLSCRPELYGKNGRPTDQFNKAVQNTNLFLFEKMQRVGSLFTLSGKDYNHAYPYEACFNAGRESH